MKTVIEIISQRISEAILKATEQNIPAIVTAATDARFGDYQSNSALSLAKQLKANPRQLAEKIIANLDISDVCQAPEIAGAGFINLRLKPEFITKYLSDINADKENLGIEKNQRAKTVVVDFSGPNIAKQMHVGHLRSTIIGDSICRMLKQAGWNVIPQNHIGDWGLQMGMLLAISEELKKQNTNINVQEKLDTLEDAYKQANQKFKDDSSFAEKSRKATYTLQNHDAAAINQWQGFRKITLDACNEIYNFLSVGLTDGDIRGESFYTDKLGAVVNDLKKAGLAVESDGAICVFPEGFKTKEGNPMPFIIQKSDGAFLYATTDLAALRFRVDELKADEIIYVTDARQKLHFEMLFKVAEMAGWKKNTNLVHITFGSVMGEDGKPLKTRSGENVKLKELLDEAVKRAKQVVEEKNPQLADNEKEQIAKAVGIGAVKYADYANNRTSDYIFSFDKMLAMDGNTAPYMQYAYARVKSIGRKGQEKGVDVVKELANLKQIILAEPAELELAKQIIKYSEAFNIAIADFKPNFLTAYLYDLAGKFSAFYNACPVLDAEAQTRASRLLLCDLTAQIIKHGLTNLLGIDVLDKM